MSLLSEDPSVEVSSEAAAMTISRSLGSEKYLLAC